MKKMSKNNELHSQKLNCCDKYKLGGGNTLPHTLKTLS
jgi:hypothetical protein